jgi:hypothetical protein
LTKQKPLIKLSSGSGSEKENKRKTISGGWDSSAPFAPVGLDIWALTLGPYTKLCAFCRNGAQYHEGKLHVFCSRGNFSS